MKSLANAVIKYLNVSSWTEIIYRI